MKFHTLRLRQNVPLAVQVNMITRKGFFFLKHLFQICFFSPLLCLADGLQLLLALLYINKLNC